MPPVVARDQSVVLSVPTEASWTGERLTPFFVLATFWVLTAAAVQALPAGCCPGHSGSAATVSSAVCIAMLSRPSPPVALLLAKAQSETSRDLLARVPGRAALSSQGCTEATGPSHLGTHAATRWRRTRRRG